MPDKKKFPIWIWAATIGLTIILKAIYFFISQPDFLFFWDYLGHLQAAQEISWPWLGGWNNFYWGGYPSLLYPPFSHWLLKALLMVIRSKQVSLAMFMVLSHLLFFHALWQLTQQKVGAGNQTTS